MHKGVLPCTGSTLPPNSHTDTRAKETSSLSHPLPQLQLPWQQRRDLSSSSWRPGHLPLKRRATGASNPQSCSHGLSRTQVALEIHPCMGARLKTPRPGLQASQDPARNQPCLESTRDASVTAPSRSFAHSFIRQTWADRSWYEERHALGSEC